MLHPGVKRLGAAILCSYMHPVLGRKLGSKDKDMQLSRKTLEMLSFDPEGDCRSQGVPLRCRIRGEAQGVRHGELGAALRAALW